MQGSSSIVPRPVRCASACGVISAALLMAAAPLAHAFTTEQVRQGAELFRVNCARCHGPSGEGRDNAYKGMRAPELIGPNALPLQPRPYQRIRRREFRTAVDVFDFASAAMPADQPASLYAQEYWAVLSFVLASSGRFAQDQPLNDSSAPGLVLHPNEAATAPRAAGGPPQP